MNHVIKEKAGYGIFMEKDMKKDKYWKNMNFRQKLQYLWDYDKWILAVIAGIVAVAFLGFTIFKGVTTKNLLNIVITDGEAEAGNVGDDFKKSLGITDKKQAVTVDTTVTTGGEDTTNTAGTVKLTTLIAANAADVILCDEAIFEEYDGNDAFRDMKEVLGGDYEIYESYISGNSLCVPSSAINVDYALTPYDTIYICVPVNSEKVENAKKFIEFLVK